MKASPWISAILTGLLAQTALAQSMPPSNISPGGPSGLMGTDWRAQASQPPAASYAPLQPPATRDPRAQAPVTHHLPPAPSWPAPADNRSITLNPNTMLESLPAPMRQAFTGFAPDHRATYYPYVDRQEYGYYLDAYTPPPSAPYGGYYGYEGYPGGYAIEDYGYSPYYMYGQEDYAPTAYGPAYAYPPPYESYPGNWATDTYGAPPVSIPGNRERPSGYNSGFTNAASAPHTPYVAPQTGYRGPPSWPTTSTQRDKTYTPPGHYGQTAAPVVTPAIPPAVAARLPLVDGKPARFRPWQMPDPGNGQAD